MVVLRYFVAVLMLAGDRTTRDCGAARSSETLSLLASGARVLQALATDRIRRMTYSRGSSLLAFR
jgi:hypothetical protein